MQQHVKEARSSPGGCFRQIGGCAAAAYHKIDALGADSNE